MDTMLNPLDLLQETEEKDNVHSNKSKNPNLKSSSGDDRDGGEVDFSPSVCRLNGTAPCASDERSIVCPSGCVKPVILSPRQLKKEPLFGDLSDVHNERHWVEVQSCLGCKSIVGISICGQVWTGEECLRSSDLKLNGLQQVESYRDRLVVYVLTQVMFQQEDSSDRNDVTFLCPGPKEFGKIMWINGEAAAFYTLKPKGSAYTCCSYMTYQMPMVDLVYVRSAFRRRGLALALVTDVLSDHPDQDVGFSEPVSDAMLQVLAKYLEVHTDRRDHVWEVSWTGQEGFRNNIWLLIRRLRREKNIK